MIVRVLLYFLELLSLLAFKFSKNIILPVNLSFMGFLFCFVFFFPLRFRVFFFKGFLFDTR